MMEFLKLLVTSDYFVGWFTGFGLICIAFLANKISKQQLKISRRKDDLSVYDDFVKVYDLMFERKYEQASKLAHRLFSRSKLIMPKNVLQHLEKIKNSVYAINVLHDKIHGETFKGVYEDNERSKFMKEKEREAHRFEWLSQKTISVFQKHMGIRI